LLLGEKSSMKISSKISNFYTFYNRKIIWLHYIAGAYYYKFILPYSVQKNTFSLDDSNPSIAILYNDPDIPYRDMLIVIKLQEGEPIQIKYMKCSDDAYEFLEEGESIEIIHNIAGALYIELEEGGTRALGSYNIIDRVSPLVPKSATKACTYFPYLAFAFNYTIILLIIVIIISAGYLIIFYYRKKRINS